MALTRGGFWANGTNSTNIYNLSTTGWTSGDLCLVGVLWYSTTVTINAVKHGGSTGTSLTARGSTHTGGTADGRVAWYTLDSVSNTGTQDIYLELSASGPSFQLIVWRISGHDTAGAYDTSAGSTTGTLNLTTATANEGVFLIGIGDTSDWSSVTGYTDETVANLNWFESAAYDLDVGAAAAQTITPSGWTGTRLLSGIAIKDAASASTRDQDSFRWGLDDGSESAHTFAELLNTNHTTAVGNARLLRVLVEAVTGDPPSTAYTLYAQKNGAGGYAAVPVGANSSPTLSYGDAGAWAYSALDGTSVAPSYPTGITANSGLALVVYQKPNTANGGTCSTPSGWTLVGSITGANDGDTGGYTTTLGADTGNMNIYVFRKDTVSGSESGTLTVTVSDNEVCGAAIVRLQASDTASWSWAIATGKDTSAGSVSIATGNLGIAAGDVVIGGMAIPTDVTTPSQFSAHALSQTGTTFGTVSEISEADTGTGNDMGGYLIQAAVSSGSGSGAVTMTATAGGTTTNVRGPGFVLRARVSGVARDLYVAPSSNIAAGGEATTARLTAPGGKSFATGRRWDDENGTDTTDLATDGYTEFEWSINTQSPAVNGDYWDLRVYAGSTALTTYTQTPRLTLGSALYVPPRRARAGLVAPGVPHPLAYRHRWFARQASTTVSSSSAARSGARADSLASKAASAVAADRSGARGENAAAKTAQSTVVGAVGARASSQTVKAVAAFAESRSSARGESVALKSTGSAPSGRVGARGAVESLVVSGVTTTTAARSGARALIAATKSAQGLSQPSAGPRASVTTAKGASAAAGGLAGPSGTLGQASKAAAAAASGRAGVRGSAQADGPRQSSAAGASGARASCTAVKACGTFASGRLGVRGSFAAVPKADPSAHWRYDVPAAGWRFDVPAPGWRFDVPPAGFQAS